MGIWKSKKKKTLSDLDRAFRKSKWRRVGCYDEFFFSLSFFGEPSTCKERTTAIFNPQRSKKIPVWTFLQVREDIQVFNSDKKILFAQYIVSSVFIIIVDFVFVKSLRKVLFLVSGFCNRVKEPEVTGCIHAGSVIDSLIFSLEFILYIVVTH